MRQSPLQDVIITRVPPPDLSDANTTDWFFSGRQVVNPVDRTAICEQFPGVSPTPIFSNFDSVMPAVVGHANLSGLFGTTEFQLQETPLP